MFAIMIGAKSVCTNGVPFTFVLYIVRIINLDDEARILSYIYCSASLNTQSAAIARRSWTPPRFSSPDFCATTTLLR